MPTRAKAVALGSAIALVALLSPVPGFAAARPIAGIGVKPPHRTYKRPSGLITGPKLVAAGSVMKTASVQPLTRFNPSCYGDSRNDPQGDNAGLDAASYGAFYSCAFGAWTFPVATYGAWSPSQLGAWTVLIDTDGIASDNCGGFEYLAFVVQNSNGQFSSGVGPVDSTCNFTAAPTAAAVDFLPNEVALTFGLNQIGGANSIIWGGFLQTPAQLNSGTGGDSVPDANFQDGPITGAIADAITSSTPSCTFSTAGGTQYVASTSNSSLAATVLRGAGFVGVRDLGEGLTTFVGDPVSAGALLNKGGVQARVYPDTVRSVQRVSRLATASTTTAPNDPQYGTQWNLPAINASGAWAVTTGNNVVVADIDTGADYTHPDLGSQLVAGIDETTNPPTAISSASGNTDTEGHGTAVAGVIAATTNNSIGLASLGWNTKVMPVKVSSTGSISAAAVAAGITWATDNGAKIINLSLGGPCTNTADSNAIAYAQSHGVLVVAAAGNGALNPNADPLDGYNDEVTYPAAYSGVVAVGATGRDGIRAAYSNTGTYVGLVAPGGSGDGVAADDLPLLAPVSMGTYTTGSGTSFSSPEVAAAAALVLAVNPSLTPKEVTELLESTTNDLGVSGTDIEYGTGMLNAGVAVADTPPPSPPTYGTYFSLPPARVLDTRFGVGAPQAPLGPGGSIDVQITGQGGVPASGVTAVILNVTMTDTTAPSFLTVWPTGQSRPFVSNLNVLAASTVPNLVTVKIGSGGKVSFFNAGGNADVIADVAGYYVDGSGSTGSRFVGMSPTRIMDTRFDVPGPAIAGGTSESLQVTGVAGVPADATGVMMNVTVTGPTAFSYLTVYPNGESPPLASNLNFSPNQTVPNLVAAQIGSGGKVNFYNAAGSVNVIADLLGYFTAAGSATGSRYFPVVNHRILDTRANVGGYVTPVGQGQSIPVAVAGQGGTLDTTASAVINVTVTNPTSGSYLTVYPSSDTSPPGASNLNFLPGQTIANLVVGTVGPDGKVDVYNALGSVDVIMDVAGWYGPSGG